MTQDQLIASAEALLALDARGALVPHGIGGHARTIIEGFLALSRRVPASGELQPTCDCCGGPALTWFAPNALWNLVKGGPDATDDPGGKLCPNCFIRKAEAAGIVPTAWMLDRENLAAAPAPEGKAEPVAAALREEARNELARRQEAGHDARVPLTGPEKFRRFSDDELRALSTPPGAQPQYEPGAIRICPRRDGPCPHGMGCTYWQHDMDCSTEPRGAPHE